MKRLASTVMLVGTAIAALALAQPAMAYTDLGTTGTTGAHKLVDAKTTPGVECAYPTRPPLTVGLWQLKHIYVHPPKAKAAAGQGTEKIGWQFTVQRQESGFGGPGPWQNDYTSPTWFATTDSTHNAAFTQEGVKVHLPFAPGADAAADYRVVVNLSWYNAKGKVIGTAKMRADWYRADSTGTTQTATRHGECFDYEDFS